MQERMADPQIGPDPSAGSSPAFIRTRLALASSYVKKRLYFSLLICAPNPPRHPFFPYKTKKESHHCDSITCWWSKRVASFYNRAEKRKYAITRLLSFGANSFLRAMRSPVTSAYRFSWLFSLWMMNCINTHLMIKPAAQKSDGLVYLSGIATLLQKRQILLILTKHHVLGVLLHVFVIRLTGISDREH